MTLNYFVWPRHLSSTSDSSLQPFWWPQLPIQHARKVIFVPKVTFSLGPTLAKWFMTHPYSFLLQQLPLLVPYFLVFTSSYGFHLLNVLNHCTPHHPNSNFHHFSASLLSPYPPAHPSTLSLHKFIFFYVNFQGELSSMQITSIFKAFQRLSCTNWMHFLDTASKMLPFWLLPPCKTSSLAHQLLSI